jgi:hypothetical protein
MWVDGHLLDYSVQKTMARNSWNAESPTLRFGEIGNYLVLFIVLQERPASGWDADLIYEVVA